MAFTLDKIVPWGRSYTEYLRMFNLTGDDLKLSILGCADGPASFNSEMRKRGYTAVSADPIYQFSAAEIRRRIDETYSDILKQTRLNRDAYVWDEIGSVEELGRLRMSAMLEFIDDFELGKQEGRYVAAELPSLPFTNSQFDLVLSSHFLFLYSDHLSLDFHTDAITELCRVGKEVRIFPLLDMSGALSVHVDPVIEALRKASKLVSIETVPYEFQRGGAKILRIHNT